MNEKTKFIFFLIIKFKNNKFFVQSLSEKSNLISYSLVIISINVFLGTYLGLVKSGYLFINLSSVVKIFSAYNPYNIYNLTIFNIKTLY